MARSASALTVSAAGAAAAPDAPDAPPAPKAAATKSGSGHERAGGSQARWWIAAGVTLASAMELVDTTIVNVGMADIGASLGATIDEVAWVSIGYILSAVIVLPMTGWLGDVLGRKRYFLGSIALFTAASFFCGLSRSLSGGSCACGIHCSTSEYCGWPVTLRGVATGLMYVPLTTAALSGLAGRELAEGSSIFSLTRQLGGSLGISILASRLTTSIAVARAHLVEHITLYDTPTRQRVAALTHQLLAAAPDSLAAHHRALAILDLTVQTQARLLGFASSFRMLAWVLIAGIPLVLLLGGGPARGARGGAWYGPPAPAFVPRFSDYMPRS